MKLPNDVLLTLDQIRAASKSPPKRRWCGVYFLFCGEELIYVGQSVDVLSRLTNHRNKGFDRYSVILCEPEELTDLEAAYILLFKPRLNGGGHGDRHHRLGGPNRPAGFALA